MEIFVRDSIISVFFNDSNLCKIKIKEKMNKVDLVVVITYYFIE